MGEEAKRIGRQKTADFIRQLDQKHAPHGGLHSAAKNKVPQRRGVGKLGMLRPSRPDREPCLSADEIRIAEAAYREGKDNLQVSALLNFDSYTRFTKAMRLTIRRGLIKEGEIDGWRAEGARRTADMDGG